MSYPASVSLAIAMLDPSGDQTGGLSNALAGRGGGEGLRPSTPPAPTELPCDRRAVLCPPIGDRIRGSAEREAVATIGREQEGRRLLRHDAPVLHGLPIVRELVLFVPHPQRPRAGPILRPRDHSLDPTYRGEPAPLDVP